MLPNHPDTYTDQELETWIRILVDNQTPESTRLDYKETLDLNIPKERKEAAKDICSFANEAGGIILYGVPEDQVNKSTAIPKKPYGMDHIADLESKLENIWVSAIRPTLPEYRIRKVELTLYPGKVVYVAWAPQSGLGPHMVEAYGDHRYYRRGQLRAMEMAEFEVRRAYESNTRVQERVEAFLNSPEIGYVARYLPETPPEALERSHYLVCPSFLMSDRIDFATEDMRNWLRTNRTLPGGWEPSLYGVRRLVGRRHWGNTDNWGPFTELHRNGTVSHWLHAEIGLGGRAFSCYRPGE